MKELGIWKPENLLPCPHKGQGEKQVAAQDQLLQGVTEALSIYQLKPIHIQGMWK